MDLLSVYSNVNTNEKTKRIPQTVSFDSCARQLAKQKSRVTSKETLKNNLDRPDFLFTVVLDKLNTVFCREVIKHSDRVNTFNVSWLSQRSADRDGECRTRRLKMAATQNKATITPGSGKDEQLDILKHNLHPITYRFNDLVYLLITDGDIFPRTVV